ncbi:hypothetical protein OF83DRAFT_1143598 [Amylostereum chailletii]|nr:hypothetical protein OF83DRAFT_1143598 [Amylostereum chailletii]
MVQHDARMLLITPARSSKMLELWGSLASSTPLVPRNVSTLPMRSIDTVATPCASCITHSTHLRLRMAARYCGLGPQHTDAFEIAPRSRRSLKSNPLLELSHNGRFGSSIQRLGVVSDHNRVRNVVRRVRIHRASMNATRDPAHTVMGSYSDIERLMLQSEFAPWDERVLASCVQDRASADVGRRAGGDVARVPLEFPDFCQDEGTFAGVQTSMSNSIAPSRWLSSEGGGFK